MGKIARVMLRATYALCVAGTIHTGRVTRDVMRGNAKNGYLLHYLHSAAAAAPCVNSQTDNSGFCLHT